MLTLAASAQARSLTRSIDEGAATAIRAVHVVDTLTACFQSRDDSHGFNRGVDGKFPGYARGEIERIRDVVLRREDLPLDIEDLGVTEASVDAHRHGLAKMLASQKAVPWSVGSLMARRV